MKTKIKITDDTETADNQGFDDYLDTVQSLLIHFRPAKEIIGLFPSDQKDWQK